MLLMACFVLAASWAFAQEARIIAIEGKVVVRQNAASDWTRSAVGMALTKESQVKTADNGTCTLSFDAENKALLTIQPGAQVTLESILPGSVFLKEGRVFSLIKNLKQIKKFEVKTPTAVSGARGTGWLTEFSEGRSTVTCFDDVVHVASLDDAGKIINERDISEGVGVEVRRESMGGMRGMRNEMREIKEISREHREQWREFVHGMEKVAPNTVREVAIKEKRAEAKERMHEKSGDKRGDRQKDGNKREDGRDRKDMGDRGRGEKGDYRKDDANRQDGQGGKDGMQKPMDTRQTGDVRDIGMGNRDAAGQQDFMRDEQMRMQGNRDKFEQQRMEQKKEMMQQQQKQGNPKGPGTGNPNNPPPGGGGGGNPNNPPPKP